MKISILMAGLVLGGVVSASARAETVRIGAIKPNARFVKAEYRVNTTTGTAGMLVESRLRVPGRGMCPAPGYGGGHHPYPGYPHPPIHQPPVMQPCGPTFRTERVLMPVSQLSFDSLAMQILFADPRGSRTVCANVARRRSYLVITPTGECRTFARVQNRVTHIFFQNEK